MKIPVSGQIIDVNFPYPGELLWDLVYPGRVNPLSRPRFAKGRTYQPLDDQQELRAWLSQQRPAAPYVPDIWIDSFFGFNGNRVGDVDNLLKSVFDGLQSEEFIKNDRRIVGGTFLRVQNLPVDFTMMQVRKVDYGA